MKKWIGYWLIGVSVIHTIFAVVVFHKVLTSIIQRGVFNSVGEDTMIGVVVWFTLFGAVLFICGLAILALEKYSSAPLPKLIGWSLLVLAILGVVLMPASGFWLAFPPAIAILRRRAIAKYEVIGKEI